MTESNRVRTRAQALDLIRRNIAEHGHHIYLVLGAAYPRFAYTIGLSDSLGAELVFAGGTLYLGDEVHRILQELTARLRSGSSFDSIVEIESLGSFSFRKASQTWVEALLLGATDFYSPRDVSAYQVVPDDRHWTIDVPHLERPWDASSEPIWRWVHEEWTHVVPRKSIAATDLQALRGARITEAVRWEEDYWELFAGAGPDVTEENSRIVPLATLLAADDSLRAVLDLEVGQGLWRDQQDGGWQTWGKRSERSS